MFDSILDIFLVYCLHARTMVHRNYNWLRLLNKYSLFDTKKGAMTCDHYSYTEDILVQKTNSKVGPIIGGLDT